MKKVKVWLLITGIISLLAALGGGYYAYRFYYSLVTTANVVTVSVPVPPYTLLTPDMLEEKTVPRGILDEPVYRSPEELAGKVTTTALAPGQIVYRHQAVPPAAFRYTDDPTLEVVSFPVDPARAVGGQVRIGHRVNVYRVLRLKTPALPEGEAIPLAALKGAEAEVLAEAVPVVDVRSRSGEPAGARTAPSEIERSARPDRQQQRPLQILAVAVDHATAEKLVELAVEEEGDYELWVTLAPLTTTVAVVEVSP